MKKKYTKPLLKKIKNLKKVAAASQLTSGGTTYYTCTHTDQGGTPGSGTVHNDFCN